MNRTGTTWYLSRLMAAGVLMQLTMLFLPETSRADGISGFMEYNFSRTESEAHDVFGSFSKSTGNSLIQRYNLSLDRTIYPNLHFAAGGNMELTKSEFESETAGQTSSLTSKQSRFSPFANLRLNAGVTSAGLGYSRRQETSSTSGTQSFTSITDNYNAQLGFRPHGLPTVDMFYMHLDSYDEERTLQNSSNDSIAFNTKYSLIKNLNLSYQVLFNRMTDRLRSQENSSLSQNARVAYNDTFMNDRVTIYSTYNIASQRTGIKAIGVGEIFVPVPIESAHYKAYSNENPILLNGDDLGSASENLANSKADDGLLIMNSDSSTPKSIGWKLPPRVTANTIDLISPSELSTEQAMRQYLNNVNWQLFKAKNPLVTEGQDWVEIETPIEIFEVSKDDYLTDQVRTDPTKSNIFVYRIRIRLPETALASETTFYKVVLNPEPFDRASGNPSSFTISEIQLFNAIPAPSGQLSTESISGHYELNGRVRILDAPSLFYDMNFTMDHFNADSGSSQRYFVTNSLSLAHRFNDTYSANARVTREDSFDPGSSRSAFLYSASLTATPIPALTSSLLFSGRNEEYEGQTSDSYSLFLNNSTELYRGVNVLFNGGVTTATSTTGRQSQNALFIFAANLIPHQAASVNMSVAGRQEWGTGGGLADSESYKQDNEISLSLNPVKSIYLFGSLSYTTETGKKALLTRTLGGSWAPFREGNLLYNISYNENAASTGSQESRSLAQSLRWYFRSSSYFDLSYLLSRNSSLTQEIDSYSINASMRFTF